jgi:hypothetical protein
MGVPLLYQHDPGCRFAQEADGGHSDAAKRLADWYTLHRIAGARPGMCFAVRLGDGTSDGAIYDDKAQAVCHQKGDPRWFAYVTINPPSMTVCEAASVIRFQRHAYHLSDVTADRDDRRGGPDVIPRLTIEGRERQIAAMDGKLALPLALGYARRSNS